MDVFTHTDIITFLTESQTRMSRYFIVILHCAWALLQASQLTDFKIDCIGLGAPMLFNRQSRLLATPHFIAGSPASIVTRLNIVKVMLINKAYLWIDSQVPVGLYVQFPVLLDPDGVTICMPCTTTECLISTEHHKLYQIYV